MSFKYYENYFSCSNFYSDDLTSYDLAKSLLVIQTQWIFSQKFNCELINLVWNENTSTQTTTFMEHYGDVIMDAIAYQITSLTIVYSTVYSDADQRKHQSSASLAFVRGIHRGPVNSPHNWPVTRKMLPFDDVIMSNFHGISSWCIKNSSTDNTSICTQCATTVFYDIDYDAVQTLMFITLWSMLLYAFSTELSISKHSIKFVLNHYVLNCWEKTCS